MIPSLSISQAGMQAAVDMLNVSANNLANLNTEKFKKDIGRPTEGKNGSVVVKVEKRDEPSLAFKSRGEGLITTSNVNEAEEVVNQIIAGHMFAANSVAFKTADEILGELLDILA